MSELTDRLGDKAYYERGTSAGKMLLEAADRIDVLEAELAIVENGGRMLANYVLAYPPADDDSGILLSTAKAIQNRKGGTTAWLEKMMQSSVRVEKLERQLAEVKGEREQLQQAIDAMAPAACVGALADPAACEKLQSIVARFDPSARQPESPINGGSPQNADRDSEPVANDAPAEARYGT